MMHVRLDMINRLLVLCFLTTFVHGQVPRTQSWLMNKSTIVMPCNNSGFTDPESIRGYGIVDFDWSNAKAIWAKQKPMNDEELLYKQVQMTVAKTPGATCWVYRNTIYGYPWFTDVRKTLDDPAYSPWYLKFKTQGPWTNPKCDDNYSPPRCSDYFHSQEQSPEFPHGDGDCAAPGCDCGKMPCGFYVWNHSSTAKVYGQTFQEWFIDTYMFNTVGSSPLVSGFFWDDQWTLNGIPSDVMPNTTEDMGLTKEDFKQLTASYKTNMEALKAKTIAEGKFAWQMMWTGGSPQSEGNTCPTPLVKKASCASDLRELCKPNSPAQTRAMMYSFGPGGCSGDPSMPDFKEDLANFLLVRGAHAWLGHAWLGCSKQYTFPAELNLDYGEPSQLCSETAEGSGIFKRNYSKATVEMDCNKWDATVIMH